MVEASQTEHITIHSFSEVADVKGFVGNFTVKIHDTLKPTVTSGVRLGTAAITSRGFKEEDMVLVAKFINEALRNSEDESKLNEIKKRKALEAQKAEGGTK